MFIECIIIKHSHTQTNYVFITFLQSPCHFIHFSTTWSYGGDISLIQKMGHPCDIVLSQSKASVRVNECRVTLNWTARRHCLEKLNERQRQTERSAIRLLWVECFGLPGKPWSRSPRKRRGGGRSQKYWRVKINSALNLYLKHLCLRITINIYECAQVFCKIIRNERWYKTCAQFYKCTLVAARTKEGLK